MIIYKSSISPFMVDEILSSQTNIKSIITEEDITEIGLVVSSNCGSLKKVINPNSVTSILEGTFSRCYSLKELIVGENVVKFESVLIGSIKLESVTLLTPFIPNYLNLIVKSFTPKTIIFYVLEG